MKSIPPLFVKSSLIRRAVKKTVREQLAPIYSRDVYSRDSRGAEERVYFDLRYSSIVSASETSKGSLGQLSL
jgi:hypothetical protein